MGHVKENIGFAGGNNYGIRIALREKSEYIVLINNDTVVEPDFLLKLLEVTNKKKDVGIVTGKILYYWEKQYIYYAGGKFDFILGRSEHTNQNRLDGNKSHYISEESFATACLWMIPCEIFKIVGFIDESYYLYYEDTDFCCRVIQAGFKIYYCNDSVIYHKVGRTTDTDPRKTYYIARNSSYIMEKYGMLHFIMLPIKKLIYMIRGMKYRGKNNPWMEGYNDFRKGVKGKKK